MNRLFKGMMAFAMVVVLTACSGGTASNDPVSEASNSTSEGAKVGFSVSTLNNPFFVTLTEGAKTKAAELGVELIVVNADDDTARQISSTEDLISKKVDVLIINPVDSDAVASVVKDAKEAGIKVISLDRAVNGEEVDAHIASDNVMGANMAGEYLISLIGEGSQVAELEGVPGTSAAIDRGEGFHQAAETGKLKIVSSQSANFNRAEGLTVMENILQANPDIKGVFAHNDEMALGAIEAISSAGKDIKVIGFDATDDAIKAVEEGKMAATVAQKPDLMGATAVDIASKLINGETVEQTIGIDVELIKK